MKIYTKTGDKGNTSLLGGTRVSKGHAKLEAYGTVDELNSQLGVITSLSPEDELLLQNIQNKLFNIGSLLAVEREVSFKLPSIAESDVEDMEKEIDKMNAVLEPLKTFVLPGGSQRSAQCHVARCVCRRAERRVVVLEDEEHALIIQYLNRLSDFLFILSRDMLRRDQIKDIPWQK